MTSDLDRVAPGLTIGAVAHATGIPANTIRTWERRYGFPQPTRTTGGQRLYDPSVVEHLRLVNSALEQGHRPKQVLAASMDELRSFVHTLGGAPVAPRTSDAASAWISHTRALDAQALDQALRHRWAQEGGLGFLTLALVPFLKEVGQLWEAGRLDVFHEHFASARISAFLSAQWLDLARTEGGPRGVVASLPGEQHELPLHMVGTVLALQGWLPVFLGLDSPVDEIDRCVRQTQARAVFISLTSPLLTDAARQLHALRDRLPATTSLVVGGAACPADVDGTIHLATIEALHRWATLP